MDAGVMESYEVAKVVKSPRYDGPECVEPLNRILLPANPLIFLEGRKRLLSKRVAGEHG